MVLHCALAHGGAWKGVMKLLSPDFKLYAPDLPGQGQSQDWDQKILFQDQSVVATVGLLNEIGEPCHLIGHSRMGRSATRHFQRILSPNLVNGL